MHCYVKQIQTLRVNDHRCAFLTNQQAEKENNRLSTMLPDLETTRSENLPPKEKVIVQMLKKQTNVQIV